MKNRVLICMPLILFGLMGEAQIKEFKCNEKWIKKIEALAPEQAEVQPFKKRKVLLFDLFTGFNHWVTPHTTGVIDVLGKKSGAFEVEVTRDIFAFEEKNLEKFDAVILNNNCSKSPRRDMFWDVLGENQSLTEEEKRSVASRLETNLINYVKKGNGLVLVHGAIVMQNNSTLFSEMCGGSFDYHPPQQEVTLELAEPEHPLLKAFDGKAFVHVDEPYLFNNAYAKKDFRPLLYMRASKITGNKKKIDEEFLFVSWIRKHGEGRVFFVSPSHNAQSFEDHRLLKFFLDGIQYTLGDLKCDDSSKPFS